MLREVRRGIEAALGPRTTNPAAADAENEADEPLDPEVRAEVELALATAREQVIATGHDPTISAILTLATQTRPDLPEPTLHRIAVEVLAAQTPSTGAAVCKAISAEMDRRLRIDPRVKQAMTEAFAVVLKQFRDATLNDSVVLESVGRQVHGVTGGQMREFATRLRDAVPRALTMEMILGWADAHHRHKGEWPKEDSGPVREESEENWKAISAALRAGARGLPGGSSLARLLGEQRGVRNVADLPPLSIKQILAWAEAHREQTGKWPGQTSGPIIAAPGETWLAVDIALRQGLRLLPDGSSLARELAKHRGVRNKKALSSLSLEQILVWADQHCERVGEWPFAESGPIVDAPGETWMTIDQVLRQGLRSLPRGSSLARLLAEHRGVRNLQDLSPLSLELILTWADGHHQRTGNWPSRTAGAIPEAPEETWSNVDNALRRGSRSLPEGLSLARLLAEHRGARNIKSLLGLNEDLILTWADAWHARTGQWPTRKSGAIPELVGEKWQSIDQALEKGLRKLPGGSSLARLLAESRGVRNIQELPPLTVVRILEWAEAHYQREAKWPTVALGDVKDAPGEKWANIHQALRKGLRGLTGGASLAQLLNMHFGVPIRGGPPPANKRIEQNRQ